MKHKNPRMLWWRFNLYFVCLYLIQTTCMEASPTDRFAAAKTTTTVVSQILSSIQNWKHEKEQKNTRNINGQEQTCGDDVSRSSNNNNNRNANEDMAEESPSRLLPFVTLSYAQTLDGMIGLSCKSSNMPISCRESMVLTHGLRSIHDAVLVGSGTMKSDDPRLNVRLWNSHPDEEEDEEPPPTKQQQQPRPVVIDTELRNTPRNCRANNLILCCSTEAAEKYHAQQASLDEGNDDDTCDYRGDWTILPCRRNSSKGGRGLDLMDVLYKLRSVHGIQSIMVEGGSSILSAFADKDIVDCVCVTIAPKILGGRVGLHAFRDVGRATTMKKEHGDEDHAAANEYGGHLSFKKTEKTQESLFAIELVDVSVATLGLDCIVLGNVLR